MPFTYTYRPCIHGIRLGNISDRDTAPIPAKHKFSGSAAKIHHQVRCLMGRCIDYGSSTEKAQPCLLFARNDIGAYAKPAVYVIFKFIAVPGIPRRACSHKPDTVKIVAVKDTGKFINSCKSTLQGILAEPAGFIHTLAEPYYPHDAGHEDGNARLIHAGDHQPDRVSAAINSGNSYSHIFPCSDMLSYLFLFCIVCCFTYWHTGAMHTASRFYTMPGTLAYRRIEFIGNKVQDNIPERVYPPAHNKALGCQRMQAFHPFRHPSCTDPGNMPFAVAKLLGQMMPENKIEFMGFMIALYYAGT